MEEPERGGAARRGSRLPAVLMAAGLVAVGLAAVTQAGRSDGGAPAASARGDESTEAAGAPCLGRPCRAAADPRPIRGYEAPSVVVDLKDPDHIVVGDTNLIAPRCTWHVTFDGGREWEDGEFSLPPGFQNCRLDSGGYIPLGNLALGPSGAVYAAISSRGGVDTDGPVQGESVLLAKSTDGGRTFPTAKVAVAGGTVDDAYLRPLLTAVAGPDGRDRVLMSFWDCQPRLCNRVMFAQSHDGGETFSPPVQVSPDPGGNSPSAPVVTPDGTVYLTYLQRVTGVPTSVLLARSTDGGASFTARSFDEQHDVGLQYDHAELALAPGGGALYVAFSDRRNGNDQVFFRRSLDQGATWQPAVRVNTRLDGASFGPDMSVAPNGRIDVVFFQARGIDKEDVVWVSSTDGGLTWARDRQLNDTTIDRKIGYRQEIMAHYRPAVWSTDDQPVAAWSDTLHGDLASDNQDTMLHRVRMGVTPPSRG